MIVVLKSVNKNTVKLKYVEAKGTEKNTKYHYSDDYIE